MVTRIYTSEEPKAVELEYLEDGGVVAVFDTRHDFDQFVAEIAKKAFYFLNDNTDTFDPVIVQMMIEDALESKKDTEEWRRLLKLDPDDIEEFSKLSTEGLDPKEFSNE